ncbi:hypothetical protein [Natronoglycomyces albus]|uniref:Uncharacterized protein n=1 Tax=Natronoglycomyces albus TaxID=2811108 RepID=A0A895XU42_9ACTN|nr:hypothetical protein [Natronoglycomyces albus]QSB06855.1 hypothetical protein JQS30_08210 [Natronoglycomyces albus]
MKNHATNSLGTAVISGPPVRSDSAATYRGEDVGTFWLDINIAAQGTGTDTFVSGCDAVSQDHIMASTDTPSDGVISGYWCSEIPSDQIEGGNWILEETISYEFTRYFVAIL